MRPDTARVVERLGRQRLERLGLESEMLGHGDPAMGDEPAVIGRRPRQQQLVEFRHRGHMGDGNEVAAAESAHLALDPALGRTRRLRLAGRLANKGCG